MMIYLSMMVNYHFNYWEENMGFLKNYGIFKAITGETKDERLMGVVLASLDNDDNKKKDSKKDNSKYGRLKNKRPEIREDD